MDKYFKWKVLLIVIVTAFCIWRAYPPQEQIHLGLDLQGGMQLLLQVETKDLPKSVAEDATDRVVEIIRNRIDEFGVREPTISKQGKDQVVIQLPGITDRERAKEIVGRNAHLEFQLVSEEADLMKQAEEGKVPEGYEYKQLSEDGSQSSLLLVKDALLTGDHLTNASVSFDQYGQAIVQLQFDKEGAQVFDRVTFQNIGKRLAIVLDDKVYSAPVIRDRIPNGQAQISGSFSPQQASDLALVLRAGALPAPVTIVEERTVGPSLGRDSIENGVKAGIAGILLVLLFMPVYYLISGLIADIGLFFYVILVVGSFAALESSLTLPGIAGFILSVGMAVDANVLIFERIREEIQGGKTARAAVSAGYHKALSAILDSNITTLITSVILFFLGTGPVKGFAVTLTIGILASMFSAILVTRVVFDFLLSRNPNLKFKMLHVFGKMNIPFLKGRFFAYGFSVLVLVIGILSIIGRGKENFSVEFTGGSLVQIEFQKSVDVAELRNGLSKAGMHGLVIQHYGEPSENQFVIKTSENDVTKIEQTAAQIGGVGGYQILRVDQVGPSVSQDLTKKALWAVFWASIGILIYLGVRFQWKYALAAVVALLHDTIFSFGVYALSGREINLATVAAILTIMGFSVNDTIVTFDRVRDNRKIMRKASFGEIVTLSINQTLGRTIITSLTALLSILALFFFGGSAINDFAFVLLVGFTIGIYSTIFVATALVVDWKAR